MTGSEEPVRPGGRPRRRARTAGEVSGPAPFDESLPVHAAAEERAACYAWEPFQRGHYLSVKSGVGSERIVSRLAEELALWLVHEHRDLDVPRYRFSVGSWARAEAVAGLLTHRLDEVDVVDGDGAVRDSMLASLRAAERRAAEERRELGLSPSGHAALEKRRAEAVRTSVDLADVRARGQAALDRGSVAQLGRVEPEGEAS